MSTFSLTQPAYQPFLVHIARKERISPHFMRITFTGPELSHFGTAGYGQHIKVMLPLDAEEGSNAIRNSNTYQSPTNAKTSANEPTPRLWADPLLFDPESIAQSAWWEQWRALPPNRRNVFRTYTIRAVNPALCEVAVDFVTHHGAGPAGTFAATSRIGDEAVLIGPNSRSDDSALGIGFAPGNAESILLAGDETAVPAIASICASLERDAWHGNVEIFLEVPTTDDILDAKLNRAAAPNSECYSQPAYNSYCAGTLHTGASCAGTHNTVDAHAGFCNFSATLHWAARNDNARGQLLLASIRAHYNLPEQPTPHTESGGQQASHPDTTVRQATTNTPSQPPQYAWIAGEASTVRSLRRLLTDEMSVAKSDITFSGYWRTGRAEI